MPEIPEQYLLSPYAPEPRTLVDILYDTAARYPDAAAIDDGAVQLTYSELIADIEDSVAWLAARGIGRGDRIGIRMPSGSYALYVAILCDPGRRRRLRAGRRRRPRRAGRAGVRRGRGGRRDHRGGPDPRCRARPAAGAPRRRWVATTPGSSSPPARPAPPRASRSPTATPRRSSTPRRGCSCRTTRSDPATGCWPGCRWRSTRPARRCGWPGGTAPAWCPRRASLVRSGMDLGPWLVSRDITVVSTVPTLAALWPAEALEAVRLLIFGGEACPPELAERLARCDGPRGVEHLRPHRGDRGRLRGAARRRGPGQHRAAAAGLGPGRRRQGRRAGRPSARSASW